MSQTRVVNLRKEPYDVYIGRGSKWGNPFTHIKFMHTKATEVVETREEAISRYHDHLDASPELLAALPELKGKRLGCYCKPHSCHGDLLANLANRLP